MKHAININKLQVEDMDNPIGIDKPRPRFSWGFASSKERMLSQSAYQIVVASSEDELAGGIASVWDSGKVVSNRNRNIAYEGIPLQSGKRYCWKMRIWDASDRATPYSSHGTWEMAYLRPEDWQAAWIGVTADDRQTWAEAGADGEQALPLFRTAFRLDRDVLRAKAFICGLGHFELRLNGRKVGDHALDPGWTDYDETCLYTVLDATDDVRKGDNALGVMLGNGFYNVKGGRYAKYKGGFGEPKLIMQLDIEYKDGTSQRIASGEGWSISRGPITFSCIYGGEDYDALLEQPGWDRAGFAEDGGWRKASVVPAPQGKLTAQSFPPNKVMRRFQPVGVNECSPGVYVYDFGQNFSGWMHIAAEGPPGSTIKLIPTELLNEQGAVNQTWNTHFTYTLKGDGEEAWTPRFTYTGFRYVQVEGAVPAEFASAARSGELPVLSRIEGQMIYPDVPAAGSFECSNPLWNSIHTIINWAILSNMKSVLTDCPHREKLGWLEESHLMGPSIMYNYAVPHLYRKLIDDMAEAQLDNGLVPDIAPEYTVFDDGFRDSPEWGGAYIIAAWYVYNWYEDRGLLERHYEGMKRYVDYLTGSADGFILRHGLGDWCDAGPNPGLPQNSPIAVTATGIYSYLASIMETIASILGREDDSRAFAKLAKQIKDAFNEEFLDRETFQYASGSQTSNAMPLAVGIVPDTLTDIVADHIVRDIRAKGNSLTGGDIGFRFLLMALKKCGRADAVADMLLKTDNPSYGYQIAHGATTLTELWDGPTAGLSQNHFMLGHAEEWFYSVLAGIRIPYEQPDFRHLAIAPALVGGIEWVKAHHDTGQGRVEVNWKMLDADRWRLDVAIPVHTTADVHIPAPPDAAVREGGEPIESAKDIVTVGKEGGCWHVRIGSGSYSFEISRKPGTGEGEHA